jgi:hypothetical protein
MQEASEGAESPPLLYHEVQWNTIPWVWAVLLGIAALMWYGFYVQIVGGTPFGSNPASDRFMVLLTAILAALPGSDSLSPPCDGGGAGKHPSAIGPLSGRRIPFRDIASYEVRTYSALREYGGWGIRLGRNGKAYNKKGSSGIQLVLASGERILIGTQEPERFIEAIQAARGAERAYGDLGVARIPKSTAAITRKSAPMDAARWRRSIGR